MSNRFLALTLLLPLLAACSAEAPVALEERASEPATEESVPEARTRLRLQTSPLVELYFEVRALAADPDSKAPEGLAEAVAVVRDLQDELGSFGGWGVLESVVLAAESPRQMREVFEQYPEPMRYRGRERSIRDRALRLTDGLESYLPTFEANVWPARKARVEERRAWLTEAFLPKHEEAFAFMMDSLGIDDPKVEVPVVLVSRSNPPGAMTYRLRGGLPAVMLAVEGEAQGDQLIEVLLHEATHCLDSASEGRDDAFEVLRAGLEAKGVGPGDYLYGTVPHTLMFIQAEHAARRFYNPDHVPYGETFGVYERAGGIARVERAEWARFLAGEQTREEALERILAVMNPDKPRTEDAPS